MKGCDISSHQGTINFHSLRDNLEFVIIRSTFGNGYKDINFEKNRDDARSVGLCIGFYHYAYPQYNTAQAEADWFTKTVSCQPGEILVLDFEESYTDIVNWCKAFLDKVTSNMGFKPLIYLNQSQVKSFDWSSIIKAGYGLWLAQYDNNPDGVPVSTPWPVVAMRQYSDKGNVGGLTPLDLDVFYGTVEQFKKYGNPPPTPAPSTPEPPVTPPSTPEPTIPSVVPSTPVDPNIEELNTYKELIQRIRDILYGKGWWWTRINKLRVLLPE
jgi:lysozyme